MVRLQVEPEARRGVEIARQAHGRVGGDPPLAVQNRGDAVGGHMQLERQRIGAHLIGDEVLLAQDLSRMGGDAGHVWLPQC